MVSILERDDCIASRPNDNSKEENDYSHDQVIYSPPEYKEKKSFIIFSYYMISQKLPFFSLFCWTGL